MSTSYENGMQGWHTDKGRSLEKERWGVKTGSDHPCIPIFLQSPPGRRLLPPTLRLPLLSPSLHPCLCAWSLQSPWSAILGSSSALPTPGFLSWLSAPRHRYPPI